MAAMLREGVDLRISGHGILGEDDTWAATVLIRR
jgi:hypothetical protein